MTEPLATSSYFEANFGPAPARVGDRLQAELNRASRYVRSADGVPDVDARITAGTLDRELVSDVVCEMVQSAAASDGGGGVQSIQVGAGPYQETRQYANPIGDLYLTKKQRRLLGGGRARAGSVDLLAGLGR